MKNLKIDNYTIKTVQKETNSNYSLFMHVFEGKNLICGTTLKSESTDLEIVKLGLSLIEDHKNNKNKTLEEYLK
jgi:hypothetical protein